MKNLFLFLMLLSCLCSCRNNDIESDATENLKFYMKEWLFHPDKAELINTHTTYKSDSLCIIHCTLKAPNNNGDILSLPIEYVYIDAILNGKKFKAETITALGDDYSSKEANGVEPVDTLGNEDMREEITKWKKEGFDYVYIVSHSVKRVKEKYRNSVLKVGKFKKNEPNIEDKITFAIACLKIEARGREINDEKGRDIKLQKNNNVNSKNMAKAEDL